MEKKIQELDRTIYSLKTSRLPNLKYLDDKLNLIDYILTLEYAISYLACQKDKNIDFLIKDVNNKISACTKELENLNQSHSYLRNILVREENYRFILATIKQIKGGQYENSK